MSSAICWENMMVSDRIDKASRTRTSKVCDSPLTVRNDFPQPLLRTHYYKQGTQIHCVPTVDGRPTWESAMRMIAMEGRCFVLSACQISRTRADCVHFASELTLFSRCLGISTSRSRR